MQKNTCTLSFAHSKPSKNGTISNVQAYGSWLNTMPWSYYCTFTTHYQMSLAIARRSMVRLHKHLAKKHCTKPCIFWVAEPFDIKYGCHIHALIAINDANAVTVKNIKNAWQIVSKGKGLKEYNNTTIKMYDHNKGGNFYVSKYLLRQNTDYDYFF